VSVRVATGDDSAVSGADYRAHRGVARFRPGQRSIRFNVAVLGETRPEDVERFFLGLSRPKGARLRTHQATATIPANDLPTPFTVSSTLTGAAEVDEPPSPNGHGEFTMTLDAAQSTITYSLTVTGMALDASGICRGAPLRAMTEVITRLADPNPPGVVTGTKQIPLKPILEIYENPSNFCVRAANSTRSELIRGQLARP
jgi:hypothetical protein